MCHSIKMFLMQMCVRLYPLITDSVVVYIILKWKFMQWEAWAGAFAYLPHELWDIGPGTRSLVPWGLPGTLQGGCGELGGGFDSQTLGLSLFNDEKEIRSYSKYWWEGSGRQRSCPAVGESWRSESLFKYGKMRVWHRGHHWNQPLALPPGELGGSFGTEVL